jgi:amidase
MGHSNVPAHLGDYQSANTLFGCTANPWDRSRTAGGSSGGAAAALASGMTPLEIGSDLAGSIRQPAHFCGVYGLKATEHRVPATGFFRRPGPPSLRIMAALGPMARSLDDLELALSIVSGPDGRSGDVPPVPFAPHPRPRLKDLRLAVVPAVPGALVAAEIQRGLRQVATRAEEAGARVEERLPTLDWEALEGEFGELVQALVGAFSPGASHTLAWYLGVLGRRDTYGAVWASFFESHDALVLPSAPLAAFPHCEQGVALEVDGQSIDYWSQGRLLVMANLVGLPALVVPAGLDSQGLPMSVQIVGPMWSEPRLLAIARALEQAGVLPGFQRPPGY